MNDQLSDICLTAIARFAGCVSHMCDKREEGQRFIDSLPTDDKDCERRWALLVAKKCVEWLEGGQK